MPLKEGTTYQYISQEKGAHHAAYIYRGSIHFCSRSRSRSEGKAQAFTGVSLGRARQDRANGLGLASLNNSGTLWAIGLVSSCWSLG